MARRALTRPGLPLLIFNDTFGGHGGDPLATPGQTPRKRGRPKTDHAAHRELAARIAAEIDAGQLAAGAPLPPIRRMQKRYRTGYRTVWLAVKILKAEGRVTPGANRRLLVRPSVPGGTSALGPVVVVTGYGKLDAVVRGAQGRALLAGLAGGAGRLDRPLLVLHGDELNERLPDGFASLQPSGVVLYGIFKPEVLRAYERLGVPAVLVDRPDPAWKGLGVHADNAGAMRDAVRRLADLGHRRIACVRFVSFKQRNVDLDARERAEAFLAALKEAGLPHGKEHVFNALPGGKRGAGGIERMLAARPRFTAVLATDVHWGQQTMKAALALGLKVPGDLSIAGFQAKSQPQKTVAGPAIDFEAMGREAVALLRAPGARKSAVRVPAEWHDGRTVAKARE